MINTDVIKSSEINSFKNFDIKKKKQPENKIDLKSYPKNIEQWWMWLDSDWINVLNIIKMFTKDKNRINQIEEYKETKDVKIGTLLEACWDEIPENKNLQYIPGWYIFSEIISEIDLLERNSAEIMALFKHRYHILTNSDNN